MPGKNGQNNCEEYDLDIDIIPIERSAQATSAVDAFLKLNLLSRDD